MNKLLSVKGIFRNYSIDEISNKLKRIGSIIIKES